MSSRAPLIVVLFLALSACSVVELFPSEVTATESLSTRGDSIRSYHGVAHCDEESVEFLDVAGEYTPSGAVESRGYAQYVRDTAGALGPSEPEAAADLGLEGSTYEEAFASNTTLPDGARDTDLNTPWGRLWFDDDEPNAAYLVTDAAVERWPNAGEVGGCA